MSDPIEVNVFKVDALTTPRGPGVSHEEMLDELLDLGIIDQEDHDAMLTYYNNGGK